MQHLLPPAVISEVGNTGILQIHSQFSKRVVSSEKPLVKLPGYCQGTSGRSCVFRTMWPDKGAKEAPQVQSIAKAIYGQTYLDEEVNALKKVRYDYQVLSGASVESHHLRLGSWLM